MNCDQICARVRSNQLAYDEALRIVGYVEKVTKLLGLRVGFNGEEFLNKTLELSFTPEDSESLLELLSGLQEKHQEYQQRVDLKNQARQEHTYNESEEYRPRRKKGHHR